MREGELLLCEKGYISTYHDALMRWAISPTGKGLRGKAWSD